MGYNKQNFKRIRESFATKALRAQEEAEIRREEVYGVIPEVREIDRSLSSIGLLVMKSALKREEGDASMEALRSESESLKEQRRALLQKGGYPEDYTALQYECESCGDTGYCGIKMCDCMKRALVIAGMESSGLASLIQKQTFENFSLDYYKENMSAMTESYRRLYAYAHNFKIAPDCPAPKNLLLLGGTGLGKTHISTAIAGQVIENGYDVFYNSAVGMLSDFEYRRFGNGMAAEGTDDTSRYTECDLLIIDDLGTEVVNQFTLSCLYYVINTRLNMQKPTIINTNLTSQELRKTYSDRISSRLMGEFMIFPFYGTDIRKQKIQRG